MSEITVTAMGERRFGVQVREGDTETSHDVTVPDDLAAEFNDEEAVVRESFEFLLEREPATSILDRFSLEVIPNYFPEYHDELARRLS